MSAVPTDVDRAGLVTALDEVRAALRRHAGRAMPDQAPGPSAAPAGVASGPAPDAPPAADASGAVSALDGVCQALSLSDFERTVLVLAAGPELDGAFPGLCAAAHGDPARPYPTFGLALAALPGAHWSALSPAGPLRRWRLVAVEGPSPANDPLRIDEYVLHLLVGAGSPDRRLTGLAHPDDRPLPAPARSLTAQADVLARLWSPSSHPGSPVLPCLSGPDPDLRLAVARLAAAASGLRILRVDAAVLPADAADLEHVTRLVERTCVLEGRVAVLELDHCPDGAEPAAYRLADDAVIPVALSARDPLPGRWRRTVSLEVARPDRAEQFELWRSLLRAAQGAAADTAAAQMADTFDLDPATITGTAALAETGEPLREAARRASRPRMESLARRIEPTAALDQLVLPSPQRGVLTEMALHVRHRATVYDEWGLGRGGRGLGTTALFAGPSGTGKTMAAEALAAELDLDLYQIDLSAVVSKYIGETEKNLRRLFDAADRAAAVLLFDEADALFGRRTEVRDSHDRYANVEVSYLLQRMEQYRGIAVLTTNFREALDPAFARRIQFVVEFPFPDLAARLEIWRGAFPARTPVDGLDLAGLARLNLAGGGIRSVAVNAAFHAAADGGVVRTEHVLQAARAELAKLGLSTPDLERTS